MKLIGQLHLFIVCLLSTHCQGDLHKHEVSYYYWKSNFQLTVKEESVLTSQKVRKLYVKYFDVKYNPVTNKIFPVASIKGSMANLQQEVIPTLYIENAVFKHLDSKNGSLASQVWGKIASQNKLLGVKALQEIHVDCDWTVSTKEHYFQFLEELRNVSQKEISSTVRLHQIKYAKKTGVPPVKKAVLMCYNMGEIQNPKEKNSILNLETLKNYAASADQYPLLLDVALPLFEWTVVFRNNKFAFILNTREVYNDQTVTDVHNKNEYTCIKSCRFGDKVLLKGDILRREAITDDDLETAVRFLDTKISNYNLIFYHLDEHGISPHEAFITSIPR